MNGAYPPWAVDFGIATSFVIAVLATIAAFTAVKDIVRTRRMTRDICMEPRIYALFFTNRLLIALAVLCYSPMAAWQFGIAQPWFSPELTFWSRTVGNVLMTAYFLISETIRLVLSHGLTLRDAIRRSWLFVFAAIILGVLGLLTVWT